MLQPGSRDFLFSRRGAAIKAPLQTRTTCLAPSDIMVVAWRFACAVVRLRAELNTELAPLSHMLINGLLSPREFSCVVLSIHVQCTWRICPRCGSLTPRYTSLAIEAHSPSKYSAYSSERRRTRALMEAPAHGFRPDPRVIRSPQIL